MPINTTTVTPLAKKLRIKNDKLRWVCPPSLIPAKLSSDLKPDRRLAGPGACARSGGHLVWTYPPRVTTSLFMVTRVRANTTRLWRLCRPALPKTHRPVTGCTCKISRVEHKPVALRLPACEGVKFKSLLDDALNAIADGLPSLLEGDETKNRRKAIEQEFQQAQESGF